MHRLLQTALQSSSSYYTLPEYFLATFPWYRHALAILTPQVGEPLEVTFKAAEVNLPTTCVIVPISEDTLLGAWVFWMADMLEEAFSIASSCPTPEIITVSRLLKVPPASPLHNYPLIYPLIALLLESIVYTNMTSINLHIAVIFFNLILPHSKS